MADLRPEDIKDPDRPDVPPPTPPGDPQHEPPEDEEDEEPAEEEPKEKPNLAAVAKHLIVAVVELARQSGSHPAVVAALDKAKAALGK